MPDTISIAAVQMIADPAPTPERLNRAAQLISKAADRGADLVVLPEFFNIGYEYSDRNYRRAERLEGETISWMKKTAAERAVHLVGTLLLLDQDDIYNAMILAAPDGRLWRYDKHYPWQWERAYFRPGTQVTVAETDLGKLGMLICWDVAHTSLWHQYAGRIDAMVVSSCPPSMHELLLIMPNREQIHTGEMGPLLRRVKTTSGQTFGAYLRRQARTLGVPVVNTTGTGTFASTIPASELSLGVYGLLGLRANLIRHLPRAREICAKARYFNETYVADANGEVIAQVAQEAEDFAIASVRLADVTPIPKHRQPVYGLSILPYVTDWVANIALAPIYRRKVRQLLGE